MKPFVDFFHRTELSLKCALGRSDKKLLSILKERGQTHYAAADYAGLDGMVEQLFTCKDNGIIPILGFEAFVNEYRPVEGKELTFKNLSTGEIKQAEEMDEEERDLVTIDYPIGLFALDMTGYHNMMSVHNDAQLNGVWKRPRTSMSFLKGHGKGLLAVLRTPDSEVGSFIYSGEKEKALEKMRELLGVFEDVYLSVTIAKDSDLREIGAGVVEFADENGFKVIPVVNSHYLRPEDEKTWDTARRLAAISRSKGVMPFEIDRTPDMSYHCREEVDEIFSEYVESEAFGEERYEKCQAELDSLLQRFKLLDIDYSIKLPRFENGEERLRKAAWDGFKRLGYDKMGDQYKERLEYELDNITGAGFANYFLIEEEVFDWYRKEKSPVVAVGRGSAAGSLVLNCLGCTNIIDPIKSRLLFERFLDAERFRKIVEAGGQVSGADCPDVDSDWATPMHDVVKRHFIDVYGERCTASIGTRGTMKTKAVLKDLARLYDIPQAEINAVTKGIDSEWADNEENEVTVADLEAKSPELKALLEKYPDFCRSFEEIRSTVSNWGVHAGGVLITDFDLTDQLPLRKDDDGRLVTCWTEGLSSRELGMMGFIKFDMLAIAQINIIDDTLRLIKQTRGKDIDWTEIPLGDYKALNQLNKHDGICVFQFDTALAAKVTDNMGGVKSFEDLGSLSTLMRPAALQNGFDKEFGLRRAGKSDGYVPDCLKQYLADTYGLPIYQEHIMQIAMALAGFDKVEAYSFMKKVYKNHFGGEEEKKKWKEKFKKGCRNKIRHNAIEVELENGEKKIYELDDDIKCTDGKIRKINEIIEGNFEIELN